MRFDYLLFSSQPKNFASIFVTTKKEEAKHGHYKITRKQQNYLGNNKVMCKMEVIMVMKMDFMNGKLSQK